MGLSERILKVFEILFFMGDSPQGTRQWRMLVSLFVLLFTFHIVWACGYLNAMGLGPGFAQGKDLIAIKAGVDAAGTTATDVQMKLLRKSIIDTKILECNAASKRYFTERLRELTDEYFGQTKNSFTVPDCKDLE